MARVMPMDANEDVLLANETLYTAFAAGDTQVVLGSLSAREDLTVMHPGWPPLRGRRAVVESWRDVSQNPPPIHVSDATVCFLGPDAAIVTCLEIIADSTLAATNVWVREAHGWRLLHHQAGATAAAVPAITRLPDEDLFH